MTQTRRSFLKRATILAGMPAIIPGSALGLNGAVAPSNRIVIGGIGLGPRGRIILKHFLDRPDVQFVAICDPQAERSEIIRRTVNRHYENEGCTAHRDMDAVIKHPGIDAVVIATGERWHAPASVRAARAGKDIYCEKPCTMSIDESRELEEAVTATNRIFQAGTQRRNLPNFALACQLAREGKLGKLNTLHAGIVALGPYYDPHPAETPIPDLEVADWDLWLGPAAERPFNIAYLRGRWRGHEGLSASWQLPEWGSHTLDLCQWAADADATAPVEYEPEGTTIHAKYASGIKVVMRTAGFNNEGDWLGLGSCPVRFEGEDAWVEAGDSGKIVASRDDLIATAPPRAPAGTRAEKHVHQFLDCVKSRTQPVCNAKVTRHGHVACHAAAIAWNLGRKLTFDPATEMFIGDDEANALRKIPRRAPYDV
ncbi:MAG: Gfo/Idh/MocA family protein [Luteolibacter sp.]